MTLHELDDTDRARIAEALEDVTVDMRNDVEYLLSLVGTALEDDEAFDADHERALWAVAQWCQEVNVRPDLADYETSETVPPGEQAAEHPRHPNLREADR